MPTNQQIIERNDRRVARDAGILQTAIENAFRQMGDSVSIARMTVLIEAGQIDQLIEELQVEKHLDEARAVLNGSVAAAVDYQAKQLPKD